MASDEGKVRAESSMRSRVKVSSAPRKRASHPLSSHLLEEEVEQLPPNLGARDIRFVVESVHWRRSECSEGRTLTDVLVEGRVVVRIREGRHEVRLWRMHRAEGRRLGTGEDGRGSDGQIDLL